MPKTVKLGVAGAVGMALLFVWWDHYGSAWTGLSNIHAQWVLLSLGLLGLSLGLQWLRTCLLFNQRPWRRIAAPVALSHGINVLAPSLLGDVMEIALLQRILHEPARAILTRLVFRFFTTVAALVALAGVAIGSAHPSLGFGLAMPALLFPFLIDVTTPWWSHRLAIPNTESVPPQDGLGWAQTAAHTLLSLLQHALSAASVFVLGAAINDAVSPPVAAGMLSLADIVTYLPVPLAGVGIHHWGVSSAAEILGAVPTGLVLINHTVIVLVGGACAVAGWWGLPDKSSLNRQNG